MGFNWQVCRSVGIALVAGASMLLMGLMSTTSIAISRADNPDDALNALMMGGSGMPTPSEFWQDTIITDYIDPATGGNYTPVLVPTPESFSSTSVSTGLADLQAAMAGQHRRTPAVPCRGLFAKRSYHGLGEDQLLHPGSARTSLFCSSATSTAPTAGSTSGLPVCSPRRGPRLQRRRADRWRFPTIDIANQYDFFADFPQYPTNRLADLNAVFGFIYAHAAYGDGPLPEEIPAIWPDSDPLTGPFADEYVLGSTEIVKQVDGDTTFYFIPTTELPLLDPLRSLGVPESVLNIFQPALQVIVEAGYDRSIPFGDPTPAELIPTIDPVTFTLEFANAVVQGANNAFELFGTQLPGFTDLESFFASAESWSEQAIGVPYDQVVTDSTTTSTRSPFHRAGSTAGPGHREPLGGDRHPAGPPRPHLRPLRTPRRILHH